MYNLHVKVIGIENFLVVSTVILNMCQVAPLPSSSSSSQHCCADSRALCIFPVVGIVMTQISFDFYQVLRTSCEAQMELTGSQNSRWMTKPVCCRWRWLLEPHSSSSASISLNLFELFLQGHRDSLLSAAPTIVCNDFEYFLFKVCQLKGDGLPPSPCVCCCVNMTSLRVCSIVGVSVDIVSLGIT